MMPSYLYKQTSEAYYADQEAGKAKEIIDQLVSTIDELDTDLTEVKEERDDLEELNSTYEEKVEALDPEAILTLLKDMETAGAAIVNFAANTEAKIRKAYALPYPDFNSGTGSDGSGESAVSEDDGSPSSNGVKGPSAP